MSMILSKTKMFVFDMAGTTVNEGGLVYKTLLGSLAKYNIVIPPKDFTRFYGMQKSQVISDIVDSIPIVPEENKEKIYKTFKEDLRKKYMSDDNIKPMKGSFELFDFLRSKGIKVCLNTGFDKEMADFVVEKCNFKNRIDDYISSSEVSKGRPQPFMINELMKRHNITNPHEVVKIGDTTLDVLEGKNSSTLYQFAVLTGEESKESVLKSNPSHAFDDLEKLKNFLEEEFTPWGYN